MHPATRRFLGRFVLVAIAACPLATAERLAAAEIGRVVRETVHAETLTGNLLGVPVDRSVHVYLPPSYDGHTDRRYPVVYLLHGIGDHDTTWLNGTGDFGNVPSIMDAGIRARRFQELIIVMPDAFTLLGGSFYTNSPANGNWEDFITRELVDYIDNKYRTVADVGARAIAGHSMGGHGAIKLAMRHPDVYCVAYGLNPALLDWGDDFSYTKAAIRKIPTLKSVPELFAAARDDFYVAGMVCVAAAFSPNTDRPPFYVDMPFEVSNDRLVPLQPAYDRWEANFPVNLIDDYQAGEKKLRGLRFDSAFVDEFSHIPPACRTFSQALTKASVPHTFEMYNGDHRNRLHGRLGRIHTELFPYLSDHLTTDVPQPTH